MAKETMTDAEKLAAIARLAADMSTSADEYAVGLATSILAVADGSVTAGQVEAQIYKTPRPDTVGDALAAAKNALEKGSIRHG